MRTMLQNARLAAFDFDGTIADTFAKSPNGVDVVAAYEHALDTMFGKIGVLESVGGLKNRAPTELVRDILQTQPGLLAQGLRAYERHRERLASLMPKGKGIALTPLNGQNRVDLLGELLVRLKLELLLREVGPAWPRPFDGVLELFRELNAADKNIAIITSGHEPFIRKCFREWGVPCPTIVLSDDDLRPLPGSIEEKSKPSRILIHYLLMMAHQARVSVRWHDVVYFGDDLRKDGGLARNAGLPFGWFNPARKEADIPLRSDDRTIASWNEVRASLR